jgi:hypothetical protein
MLPVYLFFTCFNSMPQRKRALKNAALLGANADLPVAYSQ